MLEGRTDPQRDFDKLSEWVYGNFMNYTKGT